MPTTTIERGDTDQAYTLVLVDRIQQNDQHVPIENRSCLSGSDPIEPGLHLGAMGPNIMHAINPADQKEVSLTKLAIW